MKRNNLLFNETWRDAIRELPDDVRLEIYEAVLEYGFSGNVPVLKPLAAVAFGFIKQDIDRQQETYKQTCAQNKENGRKGGNPNFKKGHSNPYYEITEDNRTLPEITEDNPIERDIEYIYNPQSPKGDMSPLKSGDSPQVSPPFPMQKIVDMWNDTCTGFHKLTGLSDKRKTKLRVRYDEIAKIGEPLPLFQTLFEKMQDSPFLKGDNSRGWKATFDWILQNGENWRKVMEGNYDQTIPQNGPKQQTKQETDWDELARQQEEYIQKLREREQKEQGNGI